MLTVKTSAEAEKIIFDNFGKTAVETETVALLDSLGRILASDVVAEENVPPFNRSTVDGFATRAEDTFGCSESIPAILDYKGEVLMGQSPDFEIAKGECAYVPTGGEIPAGADSMVMIEYSEDFGDGTRGMLKASAPGQHIAFKGDDIKTGDCILPKGIIITSRHIAALAAMGYEKVSVFKKLSVAVISTGDELVDVNETPVAAQVRDINSYEVCAFLSELGASCDRIGIVKDDLDLLEKTVKTAIETHDMLIVSGGSSVGVKDATFKVYDKLGEVLFHGIAIKPGKPTILARVDDKPCFGLPGHPLAAYYVFDLFVKPIVRKMSGEGDKLELKRQAKTSLSIPCNHGREECIGIKFADEYTVDPIYTKSGLISTLSSIDGFIRISRDCEGISQGDEVEVELF